MRRRGDYTGCRRLVYWVLVQVLAHVAWQLRVDSGVWYAYAIAGMLLLPEHMVTSRAFARWRLALKGLAQSPQPQAWSAVLSVQLKLI